MSNETYDHMDGYDWVRGGNIGLYWRDTETDRLRIPRGRPDSPAAIARYNRVSELGQQQTGYNPASTTAKGAGLGAVVGAVGGAAAGAAIGAVAGGGSGAAKGALIGVAAGGIGGAATGGAVTHSKGKKSFNRAYASCMKARGYAVDHT